MLVWGFDDLQMPMELFERHITFFIDQLYNEVFGVDHWKKIISEEPAFAALKGLLLTVAEDQLKNLSDEEFKELINMVMPDEPALLKKLIALKKVLLKKYFQYINEVPFSSPSISLKFLGHRA